MFKIAILLPETCDLGDIWRAEAFSSAISAHASDVSVVVGLPVDVPEWEATARRFRAIQRVSVRRLVWEMVEAGVAARMHGLEVAGPIGVGSVNVPRDPGWCFRDCDFWLLLPNKHSGAIADIKPGAVYCRDLSDRYIPEVIASSVSDPAWSRRLDAFLDWRRRRAVIAAGARTVVDLTSYAGVRKSSCLRAPSIWSYFAIDTLKTVRPDGSHLVLLLDSQPTEPLVVAEAYARYRRQGGKLDLIIAGSEVTFAGPAEGSLRCLMDSLQYLGVDCTQRIWR